MAKSEAKPVSELLEWPNKDKRRFLHAVYRVGDLDRTIKKRDIPEEKYSNAFLGFGLEESQFVVELTYSFGHFAIATPDVYKFVENARAKGGNVSREPGRVKDNIIYEGFMKSATNCFKYLRSRARGGWERTSELDNMIGRDVWLSWIEDWKTTKCQAKSERKKQNRRGGVDQGSNPPIHTGGSAFGRTVAARLVS
ncbi:hypothetical protein POM88_050239 [Heracleum sosnowskyi]|uniref:Glyoxalase/fosfomycin resistance/dioxygenase domain-containing protein n=1 Tax=Heracleum sosnowskyi TaxID=360622 RepID=A0AAD8GZN6_9APIA|nr:hypothetical protein POM88_050239 [Heracleum sosnowskyi]